MVTVRVGDGDLECEITLFTVSADSFITDKECVSALKRVNWEFRRETSAPQRRRVYSFTPRLSAPWYGTSFEVSAANRRGESTQTPPER